MYKHVIYGKKDYKAYIILNKPEKLNALENEMYSDILSCLKAAESDEDVRVVIIKGNGRCFSAGFDLSSETNVTTTPLQERCGFENTSNACRWAMWDMGKPVICQLHGYALGGAFELMAPADYVITADDCQIGEPQIQFGAPSVYLMMPWLAGLRKGKELMLTGEKVNGKQAEEYGIVTKSVPLEELEDYVETLAEKIIKMPTDILTVTKWGINRQFEIMGMRSGLQTWVDYSMFYRYMTTPEIKEFGRLSAEKGNKVALKWRDDYFAGKAKIGDIK